MTTAYCLRYGSICISRSSRPSVTYLIRVTPGMLQSSNLTAYPTTPGTADAGAEAGALSAAAAAAAAESSCALTRDFVADEAARSDLTRRCGRGVPRSSATRCATVIAATRRGCVTAHANPAGRAPRSRSACGICVVLPHPVPPTTISTGWRDKSRTKSRRTRNAGS